MRQHLGQLATVYKLVTAGIPIALQQVRRRVRGATRHLDAGKIEQRVLVIRVLR